MRQIWNNFSSHPAQSKSQSCIALNRQQIIIFVVVCPLNNGDNIVSLKLKVTVSFTPLPKSGLRGFYRMKCSRLQVYCSSRLACLIDRASISANVRVRRCASKRPNCWRLSTIGSINIFRPSISINPRASKISQLMQVERNLKNPLQEKRAAAINRDLKSSSMFSQHLSNIKENTSCPASEVPLINVSGSSAP